MSSKFMSKFNRRGRTTDSSEVRELVVKMTVRRAFALLSEGDLPLRRLDSLLLLASGLTPRLTSEQTGLSTLEVIRLRDAAYGTGIAHALLFGAARPAAAGRRSRLHWRVQRPATRPRNHANRY